MLCVVLFVFPWIRFDGTFWPTVVSTQLGHCPIQNCDFLNHYLPQIHRIVEGNTELQDGWFYPPTLAILFQFLSLFSIEQASFLWTSFNLAGMCLLILMGYKLQFGESSAFRVLLSICLVSTSFPVLSSIKWGQISLWLTILCWYSIQHRKAISGLLIGIAGACKIYPMFYLIFHLLEQKVSNIIYATLGFVVCGLCLPLVFLPWEQVLLYYETSFMAGNLIQSIAPLRGGQALAPTFHRWFIDGQHMSPSSLPPLIIDIPQMLYSLFFIATILLLSVYSIRNIVQKTPLSIGILFCWLGLLSPPGWQHYFCYLPLCHILLFQHCNNTTRWILLLTSIIIERIPILFLDRIEGIYYTSSAYGTTTIALLLVLIGFLTSSTTKIEKNNNNSI